MALHINNPEADKLAQQLSSYSGKSIEDAVLDALREKVEQLPAYSLPEDFSIEEVMKIARHFATLPVYDTRTPDEILGYDDLGLPT